MIGRFILPRVLEALGDTPAVLIHGARQVGKTTLVKQLAAAPHPAHYVTLDDAATLAAASADATGFVDGLGDAPVVIDEVQRVPELLMAIKAAIDRDRRPGRYLLTGSANVLALPAVSEFLAGRVEIVPLWPLSQDEIAGVQAPFVDALFADDPSFPEPEGDELHVIDRIVRGGYPEACARASPKRRRAWFQSYVTAILQRDVRDLAHIQGLADMPRLLSLVASRTGGLLRFSDLSRSLSIPQTTLKRYFSLLEATHLVRLLPAWSTNFGLRLTKSPKVLLVDTGLACHVVGADERRLRSDRTLLGAMMETFVTMELTKQASWSETQPALYHVRTTSGREVDVVLEDGAGRLVGVEVKARATVTADDFKGLRTFSQAAGDRFVRGVVLYTGRQVVPFAPSLHAIPVTALWSG